MRKTNNPYSSASLKCLKSDNSKKFCEHNQKNTLAMEAGFTKRYTILTLVIFMITFFSMDLVNAQCSSYGAQGASRCGSGNVTIRATGVPQADDDSYQYQWYYPGGSPITGATSYNLTINVSSSGTYSVFIDDLENSCSTTEFATVTVNPIPVAPNVQGDGRCGPGDVTLSVTNPSGSYTWYFDSNGTNPIPTNGDTYVFGTNNTTLTVNLNDDATYYVGSTSSCTAGISAVTGTINDIPELAGGSGDSRCGPGSITLDGATVGTHGNTLRWYSSSSGGTPLHTGPTYTVPNLTSTTSYWAASYHSLVECEDIHRKEIVATMIPLVGQVVFTSTLPDSRCQGSGTYNYTASATNHTSFSWELTPTGAGSISTSGVVTWNSSFSGQATVKVTAHGTCGPTTTAQKVVTVEAPPVVDAGTPLQVFEASTITLSGGSPAGGSWSGTGVTGGNTFNATTAGVGNHSITYQYASPLGCSNTDPRTITVLGNPATSVSGSLNIGNGESVTLSVTSGYSYQWKKDGQNISGATSNSYVATEEGMYRVAVSSSTNDTWESPDTEVVQVLASPDQNYIMTFSAREESLDINNLLEDVTKAGRTIEYFDGLGRPMQTVIARGSPDLEDVVQPIVYDQFGRIEKEYLPYVDAFSGKYKTSAIQGQDTFYKDTTNDVVDDDNPYSVTTFDGSPLNRPLTQLGPGKKWHTDQKPVAFGYAFNTTADSVFLWSVNGALPSVPSAPGQYYPANELRKDTVTNEDGNQTITFTDKEGQVVLKKSSTNDVSKSWAETYYIYDDLRRLRFVIPPEPTHLLRSDMLLLDQAFLDLWAFQYEYDGRGRMISKQVPGAEKTYLVYDQWDRLVLTQDGNQRPTTGDHEWLFTKYDVLNRPVVTGKMTTSASVATIRTNVMNNSGRAETYTGTGETLYSTNTSYPDDNDAVSREYLTVTYYDSCDFETVWPEDLSYDETQIEETTPVASGATLIETDYQVDQDDDTKTLSYKPGTVVTIPPGVTLTPGSHIGPSTVTNLGTHTRNDRVLGQVTGTMTKNGDGKWIKAATYYDNKYRVIQVQSTNHLSTDVNGDYDGKDVVTNYYDFVGNLTKSVSEHFNGTDTYTVIREFEYDHADRLLKTKHRMLNEADAVLAANSYNEIGELIEKDLHEGEQLVDYSYNIRGWLTGINDSGLTDGESDLFGMELMFDQVDGSLANTPLFSGNVSAMQWSDYNSHSSNARAYTYSYDGLNRLETADHFEGGVDVTDFDMSVGEYDLNGNIVSLSRKDEAGNDLDVLSYNYAPDYTNGKGGNQLRYVDDTSNNSEGFDNNSTGTSEDYAYDANGNMAKDENKGIDSIYYNHLNLPIIVDFDTAGDSITYLYDAAGIKLQQTVYDGGIKSKTTDYVGEFIYETDTSGTRLLQLIQHEEGRIVPVTPAQGAGVSYDYQYHLKDHLGNTRLTFSTTPESFSSTASFEDATLTADTTYFGNVDTPNRVPHPSSINTGKAARLNNATPVGPYAIVTINKGDTISLEVYGYYEGGTGYSNSLDSAAMVGALAGAFETSNVLTEGGVTSAQIENGVAAAIGILGVGGSGDDNVPGAHLNYMIFDRNMNYQGIAGFNQITSAANFAEEKVELNDIIIDREGYLIAYLSNESNTTSYVHFDNFKVTQGKTNVVQTDDYYPFGLTFNSSTRTPSTFNRFKYNGFELMNDLNLNLYDYQARYMDPAIGRFIQVDPAADLMRRHSTYNYAFDNPIRFIDPDGMMPTGAYGLELSGAESFEFYDFSDGGSPPVGIDPTEQEQNVNSSSSSNSAIRHAQDPDPEEEEELSLWDHFVNILRPLIPKKANLGPNFRGDDSKLQKQLDENKSNPEETNDPAVDNPPVQEGPLDFNNVNPTIGKIFKWFKSFSPTSSDSDTQTISNEDVIEVRTYSDHTTIYKRENKPDSSVRHHRHHMKPSEFKIGNGPWQRLPRN